MSNKKLYCLLLNVIMLTIIVSFSMMVVMADNYSDRVNGEYWEFVPVK